MNHEFAVIHREIKACFDRQQRAGWQSPEVQRAATRVLLDLWACANNDPTSTRCVAAGRGAERSGPRSVHVPPLEV